jgi:hypothetical protein
MRAAANRTRTAKAVITSPTWANALAPLELDVYLRSRRELDPITSR